MQPLKKRFILSYILILSISGLSNPIGAMTYDTKSSQNIHKSDYFLRFYEKNKLAYVGFQRESIKPLTPPAISWHPVKLLFARFPNQLFSGGFGYRHMPSSTQSIGIHCFNNLSFDLSALRALGTISGGIMINKGICDADRNMMLNALTRSTFFSNMTLGLEASHGPLHIDCNFYIPTWAPLASIKQYYAKNNMLPSQQINYLNKESARKSKASQFEYFTSEKWLSSLNRCFAMKSHEKFEKTYHSEEGSWGTEVKTTYHMHPYTQCSVGPYCFYDPYGYFIPGMSLGIHHIRSPWDAELKYSYDTSRGHYLTAHLEYFLNHNWGLYLKSIICTQKNSYFGKNYWVTGGMTIPRSKKVDLYPHPLWRHPINSNAAPLLISSHHPRLVDNNLFFFRESNTRDWTGASFEKPNGFLNQSVIQYMPLGAKIYLDGEVKNNYDLEGPLTLKEGQSFWGCVENYQHFSEQSEEKPKLIGQIFFNPGTTNNSLHHLVLHLPDNIPSDSLEDNLVKFDQAHNIYLNNVTFDAPIHLKHNTSFALIAAKNSTVLLKNLEVIFRNTNARSQNSEIALFSFTGKNNISIINSSFSLSTFSPKDHLLYFKSPLSISHSPTINIKDNIFILKARIGNQFPHSFKKEIIDPTTGMIREGKLLSHNFLANNKIDWRILQATKRTQAEQNQSSGSSSRNTPPPPRGDEARAKPLESVNEAYNFLGVTAQTPFPEINSAYKKLALQYHPDRLGGSHEAMVALTQHFEILKKHYKK